MKKTKDKFKEKACNFVNESACEERLDEDGEDLDDAEKKHFEEDEDVWD
jgi:hypothetical protein